MTHPFRPGWLPSGEAAKSADLTKHLLAQPHSEGTLLGAVNYWGRVASWGMMQNATWGCCVFSCMGHIAIQQTAYGLGRAADVTDAEVLQAYHDVAGFNISAGPPGANPTDVGSNCSAALNYLKKHPMAGFEVAAFGHVDPKNHDAVKRAVEDFGCLSIGMLITNKALWQNGNGYPWQLTTDDGPIVGGHCVMVVGYDTQWVYVVTWGHVQKMTWRFWDKYVDEAWAPISKDWTSVTGLSLEQFGQEFSTVFACKNPFAPPAASALKIETEARSIFHRLFYRGDHS